MLDQIMNAVGGNVVNELVEKTGINMDQAKSVLPVAQESLQSGLMEQVTGGNVSGILGMFNSSGSALTDNPLFASIKSKFAAGVMSKLGVPETVAGMVAGTGMNSMISGLTNQLKGDSGEVTEDDLMSKLGVGGGLGDMAKGILGNLGGDAGNALGNVADAAKNLGGLGDKLGGIFGK